MKHASKFTEEKEERRHRLWLLCKDGDVGVAFVRSTMDRNRPLCSFGLFGFVSVLSESLHVTSVGRGLKMYMFWDYNNGK